MICAPKIKTPGVQTQLVQNWFTIDIYTQSYISFAHRLLIPLFTFPPVHDVSYFQYIKCAKLARLTF